MNQNISPEGGQLRHGRELPRSPQSLSSLSHAEYAERLRSVRGLSEDELLALMVLQKHASERPFSPSLYLGIRDLIEEWHR